MEDKNRKALLDWLAELSANMVINVLNFFGSV